MLHLPGPSTATPAATPVLAPESGGSPLGIDQRLTTIAARLQARIDDWNLSVRRELTGLRDNLAATIKQDFARAFPKLGAGVSQDAVEHMLDGLIDGSVLAFRRADRTLSRALEPRQAVGAGMTVATVYKRLCEIATDYLGAAVLLDARISTSSAVAALFGEVAQSAREGLPLRFSFDEVETVLGPHIKPTDTQARIGVRIELADALRQLHEIGFIGPLQWTTQKRQVSDQWHPLPEGGWMTLDNLVLRRWADIRFTPQNGLLEFQTPRGPETVPIDDQRPLRLLAALEPKVRQTLDRTDGTVTLSKGSTVLAVELPAVADGASRGRERTLRLDDGLRRLDLMTTALIDDGGAISLDRLPAALTLTDTELRSGSLVVARKQGEAWVFARADAWTPPPTPAADEPPMPMTAEGRSRVIRESLSRLPFEVSDDVMRNELRESLVESFGREAHDTVLSRLDAAARRAVSQTLMTGILEESLPALQRAHLLLLDRARQRSDPGDLPPERRASYQLRKLVDAAWSHLAKQEDPDAMPDSVNGRVLAEMYANLEDSGEHRPLRIDFDRLRQAIEKPTLAALVTRRYAAMVLSLRDDLELMASVGVTGPIEYARARRPQRDRAQWEYDGRDQVWISREDLLDTQWSGVAFDAATDSIERVRFNDLRRGWSEAAGELDSHTFQGDAANDASERLINWVEDTTRELKSLLKKPRAALAEGMSADAWKRRVTALDELRDATPVDSEVRPYADELLDRVQESAFLAESPVYQGAFGDGGRPALDLDQPLPLLSAAHPDARQRLDAATGKLTLAVGTEEIVWQVLDADDVKSEDRHWRLARALRELDAMLAARMEAAGTPSTRPLPRDLVYQSGELSAGGASVARLVPVAGRDKAPAWDTSDTDPGSEAGSDTEAASESDSKSKSKSKYQSESDGAPGTTAKDRTEAKPEAAPEGTIRSEIDAPTEAVAASDARPMDVDQPTTSTAEESTSRGTKRPQAEQDNVAPTKRDRPHGSSAADVDASRSQSESEYETEYQPDSDSEYQPDSDSDSDSDGPSRTATKTRSETKSEPVSAGSTHSEIAPPTEAVAASDEKPMDVDQPTTSTAEESTSRGTKRPLAKQDNVVPVKRVRPGGSSAADVDALGIVSVETTGDTSPTIPNSTAINALIVAWLDKQWSRTGSRAWLSSRFRSALSAAVRKESKERGTSDPNVVQKLRLLVKDSSIGSTPLLLLAIDEQFDANATDGQSMSRAEALSLLSAAFHQRQPSGEPAIVRELMMKSIFTTLDASRQGKGIRIDADALLRLQQLGSDGQLAAGKIANLHPVLEALSARGVIGEIKVVAKEKATRRHGIWAVEKDGTYVTRTPLSEILQAGDDPPPVLVYDEKDALPGFSLTWDRNSSISATKHPRASIVRTAKGVAPEFSFRTTRSNKSAANENDRSVHYYLRFDDSMDASAAAMDLDVAAAHLIADGSETARMPKSIMATPQEISFARRHRNAPVETTVALFERDGERLKPNAKAIEQFRDFMDAGDQPAVVPRPDLNKWRNELLPRHQGNDDWSALLSTVHSSAGDGVRSTKRRTIVLQMDDSPSTYEASLRIMDKEMRKGRALWIQADHSVNSRTHAGNPASFGTDDVPIKLVIVGQGANKGWTTTLSGYEGEALGTRVNAILGAHFPQDAPPPIDRITLLACKIASDFAASRFEDEFTPSFKISPSEQVPELAITAYKDIVLFPNDKPSESEFSQRWTVGEGEAQAIHHAKNRTTIVIKHDRLRGAMRTIRHLNSKYERAPITQPLSKDATKLALDTALDTNLDTDLDVAGSDADRINASIEKDLLFYRPDLGDELPSLTLRSLFPDDQGVVDKERLDRIAGDVTEQAQLARDIESDLAGIKPEDVDATPLRGLIDESLAGRMVKLEGREVPARFLDALGARIDGQPLTAERLRSAGGHGVELGDRLQLDSARFETVLPRLPVGKPSAARLGPLAAWLKSRHAGVDRSTVDARPSVFIDTPSIQAEALAVRLAAVKGERPGAAPSESALFTAVREDTSPTLLQDVLSELSRRSPDFDDWLDRSGLASEARRIPADAVTDIAGTSQERLLGAIAEDALAGLDAEWDKIARLTPQDAMERLHQNGVLQTDANGTLCLDAARLTQLADAPGDRSRLRLAGLVNALDRRTLKDLSVTTGGRARRLLDLAVQSQGKAGATPQTAAARISGGSTELLDTLMGVFQLTHGWKYMDEPMKALTLVQLGSVVEEPLISSFCGRLLKNTPLGNWQASRRALRVMKNGGAGLAMSGVGIELIRRQWAQFQESGLSTDSHEYRSLVASTAAMGLGTLVSLIQSGIQITAALKAGTTGLAITTKLAAATHFSGALGIPVAIGLMYFANLATFKVWWDDFGRYVRVSGSDGDEYGDMLLKFFGFDTDTSRRAEAVAAVRQVAAARARELDARWEDDMRFRAAILNKAQFSRVLHGHRGHEVRGTTFKLPGTSTFGSVFQDVAWTTGLREKRFDDPHGTGKIAWIALADVPSLEQTINAQSRSIERPQRFELGSLGGSFHGGRGDDVFLWDGRPPRRGNGMSIAPGALSITGGDGNDTLEVDAGGQSLKVYSGGRVDMGDGAPDPLGPRPVTMKFTSIERFIVRRGKDVEIHGSTGDDFFDIESSTAEISGRGGHDVFLLRRGNVAVNSSDQDLFVWQAGVDAAITRSHTQMNGESPPSTGLVQLKVDVPWEALSLEMNEGDQRLKVSTETGSELQLLGEFERADEPGRSDQRQAPINTLLISDITGIGVVLTDLPQIGRGPRRLADLPKLLRYSAATPAARRALADDVAATTHQLAAGSGDFVASRLGPGQFRIQIDVPIERLSHRQQAGTLILEERPPENPPAGYAPTRLIVPRFDQAADHDILAIWAHDIASRSAPSTAPVLIRLPDAGEPGGAVTSLAAPASPSEAIEGADTDDAMTAVTQQPHVATQAEDNRFAQPVISDSGIRVYGSHRGDQAILAIEPGRHVIQIAPQSPWLYSEPPREIHLPLGALMRRFGQSLEITSGTGPKAVTVDVLGFFTAPSQHALMADGQRIDADIVAERFDAAGIVARDLRQAVAQIESDLADPAAPADRIHTSEAVRAFFRMKGMPPEIAAGLPASSLSRLRRMSVVLAAMADGKTWPSAEFLDAYARSLHLPSPSRQRHGSLLGQLASRPLPWDYVALVLTHALSQGALEVFESWVTSHPDGRPGDARSLQALPEFARLLQGGPDAAFTVTDNTVTLLTAIQRFKGRADDVARQTALAMAAAGTLDDDWILGMRQAGVIDHEALQRLWEAKTEPNDVILSNTQRHRYEGQDDRTSLIDVTTSAHFKERSGKVFQYRADQPLALDEKGLELSGGHSASDDVDIRPGIVLDATGFNGSPHPRLEAHRVKTEKMRRREKGVIPPDLYPELPAVLHLFKQKLVEVEEVSTGGGWHGRSVPTNLVDGSLKPDEVTAWRPYRHRPDATLDLFDPSHRPAELRFQFQHPIALKRITVRTASAETKPATPSHFQRGRWYVVAKHQGEVTAVSEVVDFDGSADLEIPIDGVVPASEYLLRAHGGFGYFPTGIWITDVEFATRDVGASPRMERLQTAGFSRELAASLLLNGVQDDQHEARAIALIDALPDLNASAFVNDVIHHPALLEREAGLITLLKGTGRSSVQSLEIVRRGLSPRERIEVGLPRLNYASWGTALLTNAFVEPLRHALEARIDGMTGRRDPALARVVAGLLLDAAAGDREAIPAALVKLHDAQVTLYGQASVEMPPDWHSGTLRELTRSATTDRPALRVDAAVAVLGTTLGWIADVLRAQVMASHGRMNADMATLPLHLALVTIAAMVEGRPAVLQTPVGTSARAEERINKAAFEIKRDLEPLGLMAPPTAMQSIRAEPSADGGPTERQRLQAVIDSLPTRLREAEAVDPLGAPLLAPLRCEVMRLLRNEARGIKLDDQTVEAVSTLLLKASGGDWHAFGAAVDRLASASDMQGGELDITAIDWGAKAVKALTSTALDEGVTRMGLMSISVSLPAVVLAKLLEMRRGIISDALGDRAARRSVAPGELMLATLGAVIAGQPFVLRFPDGDAIADAARRQALTEAAAGLDALEAAGLLTLTVLTQGQPPEGQPGWTSIREGDDPISQALNPRTLLATANPRTPSAAAVPPSLEPQQSTARSPADLAALLTQAIAGFKHRCEEGIVASPAQPATSTWPDLLLAPSVG